MVSDSLEVQIGIYRQYITTKGTGKKFSNMSIDEISLVSRTSAVCTVRAALAILAVRVVPTARLR
jgi:hypothetical protein